MQRCPLVQKPVNRRDEHGGVWFGLWRSRAYRAAICFLSKYDGPFAHDRPLAVSRPLTLVAGWTWQLNSNRHHGGMRRTNTPGRIRTSDRRIRNPLLYPAELRAQVT